MEPAQNSQLQRTTTVSLEQGQIPGASNTHVIRQENLFFIDESSCARNQNFPKVTSEGDLRAVVAANSVLNAEIESHGVRFGKEKVFLEAKIDPVTLKPLLSELKDKQLPFVVIAVTRMQAGPQVQSGSSADNFNRDELSLKNYYTAKTIIHCWLSSLQRSLKDLIDPNYGLPVNAIDFYMVFKNCDVADLLGSVNVARGANRPLDPIIYLLIGFELVQNEKQSYCHAINIALLYIHGVKKLFSEQFFSNHSFAHLDQTIQKKRGEQLLANLLSDKSRVDQILLMENAKSKFSELMVRKSTDPSAYQEYLNQLGIWSTPI